MEVGKMLTSLSDQLEQAARITKLNEQIERSYSQVQDIALKAVEGSASIKAFASAPQRQSE